MSNLPPTLYSIVVNLVAQSDGNLPQTHGKLLHGTFYHIIETVHPQLSAAIHDAEEKTPFTISPLRGVGRSHNGRYKIKAGQRYWLRVTLFGDVLLQNFLAYFTQGRLKLQIGKITFSLGEIHTSPVRHKLARVCHLPDLLALWEEQNHDAMVTKIGLRFYTPTAFSLRHPTMSHYTYLFPDPAILFYELAGYWDKFLDVSTQKSIAQFVNENVLVTRYELQTHVLDFRAFKQVGFVGKVWFEMKAPRQNQHVPLLNALADIAFFTGVGSRTGMGMGQVERIHNAA